MDLDLIQVSLLATLQGLTEFLPISSSGHLLLPSLLLGWADQGLGFDVAKDEICLREPIMPAFLQQLTVRGLQIGAGAVDIGFDRMEDKVVVRPLGRSGSARIVTIA